MASKEIAVVDCPQRVAYDLMLKIAQHEDDPARLKPDPRTYLLTLYRQCHKAVAGFKLDDILDSK